MPVADVLDLSEFEVVARVGELDRANLHEGQDVGANPLVDVEARVKIALHVRVGRQDPESHVAKLGAKPGG